jgi:PAS domain S-box-containing protein
LNLNIKLADAAELALSNKKSKIRILHVDDDPCFLEVTKQLLTIENNFEIDIVTSVNEAHKKMKNQTYDAIVSDYEMPQKNGLEFLKELREQENEIPFILFTGKGREEVIVKALNLGSDRYINKNGSPEVVYCELADAINKTVERKKSIQKLKTSTENYRLLFESIDEGFCILEKINKTEESPDFLYIQVNNAFETQSGVHNVLGKTIREVLPGESEEWFETYENVLRTGKPIRFERYLSTKGRWLELYVFKVEDETNNHVAVLFKDISERKKSEEILKNSEKKYRELAEALPEIVFETDETKKVTFMNKRGLEILGYSINELMERRLTDFVIPTGNNQKLEQELERKNQEEEAKVKKYKVLNKEGTSFPAIMFTDQTPQEENKSGLRGVIINMSDTIKEQEKITLLNEKLRVEGTLVRHDARNKLAIIEGNLHLAKKKLSEESSTYSYIKNIESSLNSIETIFDFAASYERIGLEKLLPLKVESVIKQAVSLFADTPKVSIVNECQGLTVLADSLLSVVFYNLIDNSLKHGKKTSKIKIYYRENDLGPLKLFYEDDGVGVLDAIRPKLFTEGFSTGKGTGYGLFLIKKVVEFYGWKIEETSKIGQGAQFTITVSEKDEPKKKYWIEKTSPALIFRRQTL